MFSETPEEMQSEDTADWASRPRLRDLIHTHITHTQTRSTQVTAEMETERDKERQR